MPYNKLTFKKAEDARDALLVSQKKEIAALYQTWADEIGERANYFAHKSTPSSVVSERQMRELQKMLEESSKQVSNEVYNKITNNIHLMADAVVQTNNDWLRSLGFNDKIVDVAFNHVPDNIVRNIVSGQIYDSGWSLSQRIWSDNEDTMKQAYQIVAGGVAQNKSMYEIAKDLEQYVSPSAAKPWNLKAADGKKIYPKNVDYNAQRLGRTLVQHGYQQSFVATTQPNPFITDYVWVSNGSRVCDFCMEMNGKHFAKNDLPLDHPNGMCTMVPGVVEDLNKQLADWFNAEDGTYPEIDEFASNFGYAAEKGSAFSLESFKDKFGNVTNQNVLQTFKGNLSNDAYGEWFSLQKQVKKDLGYTPGSGKDFWADYSSGKIKSKEMDAFLNKNLAQVGSQVTKSNAMSGLTDSAQIAAKYGTSKGKTFNYWYTKLDDESKAAVKQLKEASGLTWQKWYEQNIYLGTPEAAKTGASKSTKIIGSKMPSNVDDLFGVIKSQTEADMLATEAQAFAKLTQTQISALSEYTGSSYDEMNSYLRYLAGGKSPTEATRLSGISKSQVEALKQAKKGLEQTALEKDLVLRRGTDLGDLAGFMDGDFRSNKSSLLDMSIDELKTKFEGTTGTYAGFTSTSSIYDKGFDGAVEMIMYAPKGAQGSSIMGISHFGTGEGETLLNAGTEVLVHKIEKSDGHKDSLIRVFVEIIGNKN